MYIKSINITNFRKIKKLSLEFNKDFNFIIGENDSGKTALIDALKTVLGTVSNDYIKIEDDDFNNISNPIIIEVILIDFEDNQAKRFIDWGGEDKDGNFCMKLRFEAEKENQRVYTRIKGGTIESGDEGKALEPEVRNLLNSIYLKPLRDAKRDLSSGRNSRLSQILLGHKKFKVKDESKQYLVKLFNDLNGHIRKHFSVEKGTDTPINEIINQHFKEFMGEDHKKVLIDIGLPTLKNILEKLNLEYKNNKNPGLGTSNLLFIASELLLLHEKKEDGLGVVLIEELEAHIHPQKQLTLIDYLQKESKDKGIQIFVTSHSPNIASKVDLEKVIICKNTNFYPLKKGNTLLDDNDYKFLERFLDTTKADLFFAKGLIFVEGIAETLLVPVIAKTLGINLNQKGISIINLNGLTFKRYINIFIKNNKTSYFGTKISVITDRDGKIDVNTDKQITKEKFKELVDTGINETTIYKELNGIEYEGIKEIQFFYNNIKTLEFDLGLGLLFDDLLIARKNIRDIQDEADITGEMNVQKKAYKLYKKIEDLKGDLSQELSFIWEGTYLIEKLRKSGESEANIEIELIKYQEALAKTFKSDKYIKYIIKALEHVTGEELLTL